MGGFPNMGLLQRMMGGGQSGGFAPMPPEQMPARSFFPGMSAGAGTMLPGMQGAPGAQMPPLNTWSNNGRTLNIPGAGMAPQAPSGGAPGGPMSQMPAQIPQLGGGLNIDPRFRGQIPPQLMGLIGGM